jgi:hypothetical protein
MARAWSRSRGAGGIDRHQRQVGGVASGPGWRTGHAAAASSSTAASNGPGIVELGPDGVEVQIGEPGGAGDPVVHGSGSSRATRRRLGALASVACRHDGSQTGYPSRWEADVVLSDGGTMAVRPIRPTTPS